MFLKKILCYNNVVVNCKQFGYLYNAVKATPSVQFKAYSCEPASEEMEMSLKANIKEGTKTTCYEVKNLPCSKAEIGKSPFWNKSNESLYYVDLACGKLMRYDTKANEVKKCQINGAESASFIIPIDGQENQFAVGTKRNVELVIWDGCSEKCCISKTIAAVQDDEKFASNRFNIGVCDDQGRLVAGTMADGGDEFAAKLGEMYMLDGKETKTIVSNLGIPSGMAWNKEGTKFYLVDGADYNVKEYEYCKNTGAISNPKIVYTWDKSKVPQHLTIPDGLTLDADGNIYVATNGGTIYKIDAESGKICTSILIPCRQVTGLTFGGPSNDILYITTGSKFDEPPPAGSLFQVTGLGAQGLPTNSFKPKPPNSTC